MNNLSIKWRLTALAATALLALVLVAGVGIYGMSKGSEAVKELGWNRLPSVEGLMNLSRGQLEIKIHNRTALLTKADDQAAKKFADILAKRKEAYALLDKGWKLYAPLPQVPAEVEPWKLIEKEWPEWLKGNQSLDGLLAELAAGVTPERQAEILTQYTEQVNKNAQRSALTQVALDKLIDINQRVGNDYYLSSDATMSRATLLIYGISLAALLLVAVFAAYLIRSIMGPLEQMRSTMLSIESSNDFTQRVRISGRDEVAQTMGAFNALLDKVQKLLQSILADVNSVSQSATTMSAAAQNVATGSNRQSEAASAMAAAVEQMMVSISHITTNASDALTLSEKSGDLTREGSRTIGRAVDDINEISAMVDQTSAAITALGEQSKEIFDIVTVIKEVADQTNLLALNAAIEAARAGEQGRGFAVVADEVRKLAERTTNSTSEISAMIEKIQSRTQEAVSSMDKVVGRVASGRDLVTEAGGNVGNINTSTIQVSTAVNEISGALREQNIASQSIAQSVEQVAQMTDENSAAATETSQAARNLESLADRMRQAVNQFKV